MGGLGVFLTEVLLPLLFDVASHSVHVCVRDGTMGGYPATPPRQDREHTCQVENEGSASN